MVTVHFHLVETPSPPMRLHVHNGQIADFGLARHLPQGSLADSMLGSPLYMAPEVLSNRACEFKLSLSLSTLTWTLILVLMLQLVHFRLDSAPLSLDVNSREHTYCVLDGRM